MPLKSDASVLRALCLFAPCGQSFCDFESSAVWDGDDSSPLQSDQNIIAAFSAAATDSQV